jgi:hypothetical protein
MHIMFDVDDRPQAVEHFLPWVEDRAGLDLNAWDTSAAHWNFKLKCAPASPR